MGAAALLPILMGAGMPAQSGSGLPVTVTQISQSATQATYQEVDPNGIPLTNALLNTMPASVLAQINAGSKLVSVSITHEFFAKNSGVWEPTTLGNWEQLNGLAPSQYNVITSQWIGNALPSGPSPSAHVSVMAGKLYMKSGLGALKPNSSVGPPPGSNGTSGTFDENQLSLLDYVTQNSTTTVNDTFTGQAFWTNYDTVTNGHTDYGTLTWWPNTSELAGSQTRSATGVNINNSSETEPFSTAIYNDSANAYQVSVSDVEETNDQQYALQSLQWGVKIYNDQSPNDLNAGQLVGAYTQTYSGTSWSFSFGRSGANLTVSPSSGQNTWKLGTVNWNPNTAQVDGG